MLLSLFQLNTENECGIQVLNKGISGNSTYDILNRMNSDSSLVNTDIIILFIGTNDMVNTNKLVSFEEFSSNIDKIICFFKNKNIDVVLVSPPPVDTVFLFERHERSKFFELPNNRLKIASEILKSKSYKHGLIFIDIFDCFQELKIPNHNVDSFIRNERNSNSKDGVHPTETGYLLIANQIHKKITHKIKKRTRIICLGDSITFGVHVQGEGTDTGNTYPAYLKQILCNSMSSQNNN